MSDFKNIPIPASDAWLDNVPSATDLPVTNNQIGDKRQALDTQAIYSWNGSGWTLIASPAAATAVTALIGDVSATGPGAAIATLKTVNLNVGEFGDAANSATVTVNAKGLVTGASETPIQIAQTQVTGLGTALSGKQDTITGAASTVTTSNLTVSRALVSNGSGKIAVSNTTATELGFVSGVTSAIQTQLNGKQPTITGAITNVTNSNLAGDIVVVTDSAGKIESGSTTVGQLNTLYDIDESTTIQAQLNAKAGKRFFRHYPMLLQWFSTFFTITPSNGLNRHAAANMGYYCKRKAYIYQAETMTIYTEVPPQPDLASWQAFVTSELSPIIGGNILNCYVVFEDEVDPSVVVPSRVSWYNKGIIEVMGLPSLYGYNNGLGSQGYFSSVWNSWKGLAMPPKANLSNPGAPAVIQSIWNQLGGGNGADFITNDLGQAVWKRQFPYSKGRKLLWLQKVGLTKSCGNARDRMAIDTSGNLVSWSTDQFTVLANGWFDTSGNMHMRPRPMQPGNRLVFACLLENSYGERALEFSGTRADQINVAHFDQDNYDIEMVVEQPNGYVKVYPMPYEPSQDNSVYQVRIDLTYAGVNTPYIYPPKTKFFFRLKSKTTNRVSEMFPMYGEVRKALRWDIVTWSSFTPK